MPLTVYTHAERVGVAVARRGRSLLTCINDQLLARVRIRHHVQTRTLERC